MVLFLMPDIDEQMQEELREALLAQFALIEARVGFERIRDGGSSLGARMEEAQRRAEARSAIAVFWIEQQADGRWFVHMMDSARERIVVRPADPAGDQRGAAIEAVAVMTRESTRALLAGQPVPQPEAPLEAEPEPAPELERRPRPDAAGAAPALGPSRLRPGPDARSSPVRLSAGYVGTDFAVDLDWRHGVVASVGWYGLLPGYAGVSYVFTPPLTVETDIQFELQRLPFTLLVGYRESFRRAALDIELGWLVEVQHLSALKVAPNSGVNPRPAATEVVFALAPRLRGELAPSSELAVFAALGLDVLINNFSYDAKYVERPDDPPRTLLRAADVRPVLELGVAFYP